MKQQLTTVVITGPDTASYSDGPPRSADNTVQQAVKPLPVGAIRVAWRTVSADGHTIQGEYTFTNAFAPLSPTPSPSLPPSTAAPTTAAAAPPTTTPVSGDDGGSPMVWWLVGAVVVLALCAGGGFWLRRRTRT